MMLGRGKGTDGGTAVAVGMARVDRRTKNLLKRIQPGEVAVIDHEDLDRVAAEGLIEAHVGAVVNAAHSLSGRYPNVGPLLVAAAGIPLVDDVGPHVIERIAEGSFVRLDGGSVEVNGEVVGKGVRHTLQSLEAAYENAKRAVGEELERFASNTLEYLRAESHLVLTDLPMPDLVTKLNGRHALIVVRGVDYKEDLAHLRSYVREMRPVLIAVDGGADALLEFGLQPDLIIGDFDSVSDRAAACGAELVVHAYPGGRAPGAQRLDDLGLAYKLLEAPGTSEDIAMLMADDKGAELLVAVGTHASMVEFLDKGRAGMASTFLVRLKVGGKLVDAKGVSRLYESRIHKRDMTFFLLAAMLCFVVVIVALFPRVFLEGFWLLVREAWRSIAH
ncbi:MAG TPA: putative cytokinetic ring protein SteA [Acidimicrobiales bacterium]|nr:putative cytokinetic ring protein SteA [Acidimicrobiales bacterium]